MGRAVQATLLISLGLASVSPASAQQRGRDISRFQQATEERRIEAPDADDAASSSSSATTVSGNPENMEDALYFRERADNLGEAARDFHDEQLTALLASREQLVVARRTEAIRLLEEFISEEPEEATEMPDALLRLAELKWELARSTYIEVFGRWQEVPEENRGPAPTPDYGGAVALYDRILRHHPDYDRLDLVLYMKAYAFIERGNMEDALVLYRKILEDFPESRFVPDAHFALAESQFGGSYDYSAALEEYENVLRFPESGLYDVALFKSAWCLWRLNRSQEAAERFRMVLDLGQNRQNLSSAQRRRLEELQDEALSYLIQVFTEDESNSAQDVFDFLEEIGGERYAHRVLRRLSETYIGQARYDSGIEAYELLLEMDPMSPEAPKYQREIAAAYASMGQDQKTVEALQTLASTYGRGSAWARNQGDPETVRDAHALTERQIRRQALMWHEEGQRESQSGRLEQAAALYETYLNHFPRSESAYQINFYIGEIYFHRLERFPEAGDAYLAAARLDPQGDLTRDSLYNAIGAFERVRENELQNCSRGAAPSAAQTPAGDDEEEEEGAGGGADEDDEGARPSRGGTTRCGESANDRKFSSAITLYVELFPNDPDLPEILFRQGKLYYDRRIYDPAIRLWGQLIDRFPQSDYAEPAGELILDSFNRADDYANIETWARRLKGSPAFSSQANQTRLNGLILASVFKLGEQLAERGEHGDAADAYFRAAEEFPTDDRARQAYFNAGVERQRDGDLSGAASAYDRLIERYPGSDEGAQGARKAAQMYESIAQFSDAARYYESYAEGFPRAEHAADSLYNAVLLRVTAGDNGNAVEDGNEFLRRFPRHDKKDDVYFFIGRAQENAENWSEAAATYRRFIRSTRNLDLKVEATTRLGMVLAEDGNQRGSASAFEDAVRLGRRNRSRLENGLYYAAQARYLEGERVLREYEAVQIAGDTAGLTQRLQRKAELLRRAATIFGDVVSFQVAEWVTAALFQIGRSFELFASSLNEQPVPEGFDEEEEASYREQLYRFIIPMEQQAIDAYQGGYEKAIELRIFNRWTASLREGLTRLDDQTYPPLREMGGSIIEGTPLAPPEPLDGLRRGADDHDEDDGDDDGDDDDEGDGDDEEGDS